MVRTRPTRARPSNVAASGKEDEPKWLLPLFFSLVFLVLLYLDHGQLPESDFGGSSRPVGRGAVPPSSAAKATVPAEVSIKRKTKKRDVTNVERRDNLSYADFAKHYDCIKPVLVTGAMKGWGAMKWTRKMFVDKYGD